MKSHACPSVRDALRLAAVLACAILVGRCNTASRDGGGRDVAAHQPHPPAQSAPEPAPPPPPPPAKPIPARSGADLKWPLINDGFYVQWLGRTWSTRYPSRLQERDGVGTLAQRNATGTYLGEDMVSGGSVSFEVRLDAGYLDPVGGGKHFIGITSWMADRSDRDAVGRTPWSRIELDNIGDKPRCVVWNYGPQFDGRATRITYAGPAFQPDRWYRIALEWSYREPAGRIVIRVDDQSYETAFEFVPGTVGPGRFFGFGHFETNRPEGCLHVRNLAVKSAG